MHTYRRPSARPIGADPRLNPTRIRRGTRRAKQQTDRGLPPPWLAMPKSSVDHMLRLTIDADIIDEQQRQDPVVRSLLDRIPNQQAVDVLVEQLPNPPYTASVKSDIRRAVNEGDLPTLRRLDRGTNSPAFTRLVQIATAINAVNRVRDKAGNGTLTQTDIRNAITALRPFTNNPQVNNAVQQALTSLLRSSNTIARLRNRLRRVRPVVQTPVIVRRRPIISNSPVVIVPRQPVITRTPVIVPSRISAPAPVSRSAVAAAVAPAPATQAPAPRSLTPPLRSFW